MISNVATFASSQSTNHRLQELYTELASIKEKIDTARTEVSEIEENIPDVNLLGIAFGAFLLVIFLGNIGMFLFIIMVPLSLLMLHNKEKQEKELQRLKNDLEELKEKKSDVEFHIQQLVMSGTST